LLPGFAPSLFCFHGVEEALGALLSPGSWPLREMDPFSLKTSDPGGAQHLCTDMTTSI
jgi:hypothetical protein